MITPYDGLTIRELVKRAHEMAREKGWYDGGERNIPEMLALLHSEISEALEDYRDGKMAEYVGEGGKPCGFASEVADVIIRAADLCGYLGVDLERAVVCKMAYNATRGHRHGGKRA